MKVASSELLSQKCNSASINDFDVTYLNKLNETISANVSGLVNSSTTNTNTSSGHSDLPRRNPGSGSDARDNGEIVVRVDELSSMCNNLANKSIVYDGRGEDKLSLHDENSDSGVESTSSSWDKSVTEIKEHAYGKLEEELLRAREILKLRDEEVSRLRKMRQDGDNELLELTASLFEEAHGMVNEANVRRMTAEKALKESLMKVDVLSAEVTALKTLVFTLTPNKPPAYRLQTHNTDSKCKDNLSSTSSGDRIFKKHHSSPSCFDLQAEFEKNEFAEDVNASTVLNTESKHEMDPTSHREFMKWRENPTLEKNNPFIERMYREDIDQCLDFSNSVLVAEMKEAIDSQNIFIEAVDRAKAVFPKKCALMEVPRLCHYRMKISDSDEWLYISQMCRNRIISVCNFLNYLRYIQRGLVKSSAEDAFWEVVRLRKEMMLAKLGLPLALLSR